MHLVHFIIGKYRYSSFALEGSYKQKPVTIHYHTTVHSLTHHGSFIITPRFTQYHTTVHSHIYTNGADKAAYKIRDQTGVKSRTQQLATYCVQTFTATLSESLHPRYKGAGVGATMTENRAVTLHLNCFCPPFPYFQQHKTTRKPHYATNGIIWPYLTSINTAAH